MSIVISNAFTVIEGRPVTSSRIVAEYFGKHSTLTILYTLSDTLSKPFLGSTFANKILQLLIHCTQVFKTPATSVFRRRVRGIFCICFS